MTSQERLRKADYCVLPVPLATCQRLVLRHHYSAGGANTATYRHGLFAREDPLECLGVAWWIPPTRRAAEASWDGDWQKALSLSRLVVVPGVPTNGASFLLAGSVRLIRADGRFRCLVTYADQWQGHTGRIYRAANWEYLGLTQPEATFVDGATGRMVARKAGPTTRTRAEMAALGYEDVGRYARHKYRLILPPARPPRTLFDRLRAPPALEGTQQEVTAIGIISTQEHTSNDRAEQTRGTQRSAGQRRGGAGGGRPSSVAEESERAAAGPLSAWAGRPGQPGLGDL